MKTTKRQFKVNESLVTVSNHQRGTVFYLKEKTSLEGLNIQRTVEFKNEKDLVTAFYNYSEGVAERFINGIKKLFTK